MVFSNLTARGSRVEGVDHVVFFGLQFFIKKFLIEDWNRNFFQQPKEEVVKKFRRRINNYLGPQNRVGVEHIEALHDLGYLPIKIMALPEGTHVPVRVPMMVIWNTIPDFFWLTNALETILSTTIWLPCTSATTAHQYRVLLDKWAEKTAPEMKDFVPWQGHDFSFRGHTCLEAAQASGGAHLLSFTGTDTIPAIDWLEDYYNADSDNEIVGGSVAATEHSVMCMGGNEGEKETFERLISIVYPDGIVSIVSDTWNFWEVIDPKNGILVKLKDQILARDGKVVIRPDSGDPVKIVTGYKCIDIDAANISVEDAYDKGFEAVRGGGKYYLIKTDNTGRIGPKVGREVCEAEIKGLTQCLWEIFGGTVSSTGYRLLDSHIGGIYGDSITLARADSICDRLATNNFASVNLVYGIGSFTYQGAITPNAIVTRDTFGFAVKSTYGELWGDETKTTTVAVEIFKDPITDDGLKKSARGITAVFRDDNHPEKRFFMKDQATWEDLFDCAFEVVFEDSTLVRDETLAKIRNTIVDTAPEKAV
jgi:nicotinamide phosphoribosyltransferase